MFHFFRHENCEGRKGTTTCTFWKDPNPRKSYKVDMLAIEQNDQMAFQNWTNLIDKQLISSGHVSAVCIMNKM